MFSIFKSDPLKALEKKYSVKLQQARDLQRKSDIVGYSKLATEANSLLKQIEAQRVLKST
jgi:hypothetical protein